VSSCKEENKPSITDTKGKAELKDQQGLADSIVYEPTTQALQISRVLCVVRNSEVYFLKFWCGELNTT